MRLIKERIERLEKTVKGKGQPITNVRQAIDAQLEHFLRSCGVNPDNEVELKEAARWIK